MNDEDLVEKFMLHVPTTVLGSSFTPKTVKAVQSEVDNLRTQLVKANERAKELEDKHLSLALWHNLDPQQAKLYSDKYVNKFAIEKKQAAINSIKDKWIKKASDMPLGLECRSKGSSCYNWAMYYAKELTDEVEQLHKEQGE